MARISSTTLFNFTDDLHYLISNLQKGIYCSNTYEKLPLRNNGYRVPMACFCDIPLSLIKEHFDWYGRYGIGIKRTYARSHGVHPLWYVTSESNLVANLVKSHKLPDYERKYLLPYLKQFIGYQKYKEGEEKRKKFYDEREWRYIPNNDLVETMFGINKSKLPLDTSETIYYMPLDLNEVEYIIIDNGDDLEEMLIVLKNLSKEKGIRYEKLVSKLITSKQIERDF